MKNLSGKVAIVTGAAGLIGSHIVRRLADDGAIVVATDIVLSEELAKLADDVAVAGGKCSAKAMDITDSKMVAEVFEWTQKEYGAIDILVNNAGKLRSGSGEPFYKTGEEYWRGIIEVNLIGTMICCQKVLPGMIARKSGRIINLASIAGVSGLPGWSDYSASKAGVILFSQTLAMEVGKHNITVNCVSPGMISRSETRKSSNGTWLGICGSGSDIAGMVAYLSGPEADFITGCNYLVDGGRVLGPKGSDWDL